jgi:hypothetical protein
MRVLCLLILACLTGAGCDTIQTNDAFEIELEATARLPAGEGMAPLAYPGLGAVLDVDLAERNEFTDRGYSADDARSVQLVDVTVMAMQPPAQTLDFFGELRVVIASQGQPAFVAARGPGADRRMIVLDAPGGDLGDYMVGERGTVSLQAGASDFPPVETTLRVKLRFAVAIGD